MAKGQPQKLILYGPIPSVGEVKPQRGDTPTQSSEARHVYFPEWDG